jgi:hypothetical protein
MRPETRFQKESADSLKKVVANLAAQAKTVPREAPSVKLGLVVSYCADSDRLPVNTSHLLVALTQNLLIGQALATFIYGLIVGTVLVTGIAGSTFIFNMGDRGWDYLRRLRGKK